MKKTLLFLAVGALLFMNANTAVSINTNADNYEIINTPQQEPSPIETVHETELIQIIKKDNKFGIFDKTSNSFLIEPVLDSIVKFNKNNDYEYKIKAKNLTGYVNTDSKANFLAKYDDIYLLDKYIKVKQNNKYGLVDKQGFTVLKPIFQKISISYDNENEYIMGKYEGKYKMFHNSGKLIPESELYQIARENEKSIVNKEESIANNLNTLIAAYHANNTPIQKINNNEENNSYIYEIKEISMPVKFTPKDAENKTVQPKDEKIFKIGNKDFILSSNKGKMGLIGRNQKEIIPAVYDGLNAKIPCEHCSKNVIYAVKNNKYTIYDLKGRILAEQVYDKINAYKYGRVYSLTAKDGKFVFRANNKIIGYIEKEKDGYKLIKSGLHFYGLHKIIELMMTLADV